MSRGTPSPRIRVLHVIDSFDLGGAQTALLHLVKHRDSSRFDVEVAAMHGRGVFWDRFVELGVPVHSLSPRKWLPVYFLKLAALLLARRFDAVHCHLFGANLLAKPLAALLGVRVRINHDQCNDRARIDSRALFLADKITNRLSSHICAVSRSIRDFLVDHERVSADRVSVVYNGVDLDGFTPGVGARDSARAKLGLPREAFVVVGVGRLHPQKNFALFLDVAAGTIARHGKPMQFVIAGTGPEEGMLREKAKSIGIADRVTFARFVADMRAIYAAADALLLTSIYEGLPLTVLEAMAMGVPVIASRLDGIEEILADGVDSRLAASGNCGEFVAALLEISAHPETARGLADAARKKVEATFSAATMAREVEAVYEQCLNQNAQKV